MTWVSLVPVSLPGAEFHLPSPLWSGPEELRLRYGSNEVPVRIRLTRGADAKGGLGSRPDRPVPVSLAAGVVEQLLIRTEPAYRLRRVEEGVLEIGPVLGMLLGNRNHWYSDWYMSREPERVTWAYPRTGGLICAFSARSVSMADRCAYGLWYNPRRGRWCFANLPLPGVIWRRSFRSDLNAVRRLQQVTGARIFNSYRFDKWQLYNILRHDLVFVKHIPQTALVQGGHEAMPMLERHGSIVLKPSDLSRGRGILFVERSGSGFTLTDYRTGTVRRAPLTRSELDRLLKQEIAGRRYICQERIDLARVDGAPFDIRVVMQRDAGGAWQCTGIECRVAGSGQLLTNIAMGGCAMRLADATLAGYGPDRVPPRVEERVIELSERLCRLLDATGESFAEFGIDLALDCIGGLWLIEANVIPTFKGFKALDIDLYRRMLAQPLLYANHLAGFGAGHLSLGNRIARE